MRRKVGKRTFWHVHPTKTQISLRIREVWWKSSLSAWRTLTSLAIQNASSVDSGTTVRMHRLVWIFARRICPRVRFLTLRLNQLSWCYLTFSVPNFRRHLSTAFFLNKLSLGKKFIFSKLKGWMSNSVDPNETSHLDQCCLQKPI